MGKYSLYIKDYKCALFTSLAKLVLILNKMEWGWKLLTGLRHTMVLVRRPFFRYDPVRCDRPMLYGTVSERAAKTIRFNTLWQWKGYGESLSSPGSVLDLRPPVPETRNPCLECMPSDSYHIRGFACPSLARMPHSLSLAKKFENTLGSNKLSVCVVAGCSKHVKVFVWYCWL